MRRLLALLVLVLGIAGSASPTLVPTPWRFGVFYWVGEAPEYAEAYVNMATNWLERVFRLWGLTVPKPTGNWLTPEVIEAQTLEEARSRLRLDMPSRCAIVPGGEKGTFWVLPPLLLGDREISPLSLVVFPVVQDLDAAVCGYGTSAIFWRAPSVSAWLALLDSPVAAELREIGGPAISLTRVGRLSGTDRDHFLRSLAHEIGHWVTFVWAEGHGFDWVGIPSLLREGLAVYTEFALSYGEPHRYPHAPASLHPVAAVWAQGGGGLTAFPSEFVYPVGLSLVDFLVRKAYNSFVRVLGLLPGFLETWDARLSEWEAEWREWLRGEVPPWASASTRLLAEHVYTVASLVEPLFPEVWDVVRGITSEEDVDRFWASISGPLPTPTRETVAKLRERECLFRAIAQLEEYPPEDRAWAQALLARLARHWDDEDWEAYAAAYLKAVLAWLRPPEETP